MQQYQTYPCEAEPVRDQDKVETFIWRLQSTRDKAEKLAARISGAGAKTRLGEATEAREPAYSLASLLTDGGIMELEKLHKSLDAIEEMLFG